MAPTAPAREAPVNRMISYIGMKMETLELKHSAAPEGDKPRTWSSEFAREEHKILGDIHQTLTLVRAFEPAVRAVIKDRLKGQKFNGGSNVETNYKKTDVAEAEGGEPVDAVSA